MPRLTSHSKAEALVEGNLRRARPKIMRVLVKTWNAEAGALTYTDIESAVRNGRISDTVISDWRERYSVAVTDTMAPEWEAAAERSAAAQVDGVRRNFPTARGVDAEIYLSPTRVAIRRAALVRGGELITLLTETQVRAANNIIAEYAVRQGLGPREVAKYLRPVIGLNEPQAAALSRYRAVLIKDGVTEPRLSRLIDRRAGVYHRARADMIARTESAWASSRGQAAYIETLQKQGVIPGSISMDKEWITANDERVCTICGPLDGKIVRQHESFPSGSLYPPAHPLCRCAFAFVVANIMRRAA